MINLWSLGGLGWCELLKRTLHETWEDEVFGQFARLAFYHFLALFPSLLLALLLMATPSTAGAGMKQTLIQSFSTILPHQVSQLIAGAIADLNATAIGTGAILAAVSAVWSSLNGTWALIVGLNKAYEVKEGRVWWKLILAAIALTVGLAVTVLIALAAIFYGAYASQAIGNSTGVQPHWALVWRIVHWPIVIATMMFCFALYRFGPNLYDLKWQWSTPGAVVGALIWLAATLGFRFYFEHFNSYGKLYGRVAAVAMLLIWLYLTGAAILIGGEVNSEIEHAGAEKGEPEARASGERKPGERRQRQAQA